MNVRWKEKTPKQELPIEDGITKPGPIRNRAAPSA